ncbi:MAG: TIGR02266 family protein, partial [bacterium]|nr:TIGR02266 family protein [bacterium]
MPTTSNRQASIDSRRIALEREVTIRVPRFDTFVTEYSTNISTTGMFIVSEKPHPPGTTFTFEFSVADDWKLIRGKAQVVWTRYRDEDKERPAGMGVRFVELDAQSRRLIRWIVEKHIREGGRPFELDELRSVIDEALEDVIETDETAAAADTVAPVASAAVTRSRPKAQRPPESKTQSTERHVLPLLATAAVIVIGLIFLFWLTEWIPDFDAESSSAATTAELEEVNTSDADGQAVESAVRETGDGSDASSATPAGSDRGSDRTLKLASQATEMPPARAAANDEAETAPEPASAGSPPLGSAYAGVRQALGDWSAAWSAQDVDSYLAMYSRSYRPASSSRAAWEALRRERLTAPEFVKVSISRLDMVRVRDDLVEATFFQNYRSSDFSDSVQKVVELVWEDG